MIEKRYDMPEESQRLWDAFRGADYAREDAVKLAFRWKRAAYFGELAARKRREFWQSVFSIYPELKGKHLAYYVAGGYVEVVEEDKEV